ncbi:MAG: recombinase family protein [Muribaculaceae bacterium]|nr:recombinase family protein [Muribaculaceae bacterium]
MARKSRKKGAGAGAAAPAAGGKVWRAAVYVRLSREDERKVESDTVENQRAFLEDYVAGEPSLELAGVYVDRHVSGTRFDRPEFSRMISDMRAGKVGCIVVKDLSRLGRNYLEAGDYIEKIFPFFGVRFIAVTDGYDSLTSSAAEDGLVVPLKNLINEAYAKDISRKICTSFEGQFGKGVYFATTAAYGYRKDPGDPHGLLVDENVRDVVIRMFRERLEGKSLAQIARGLNADGIMAPSVYWQSVGVIQKRKFTNRWEGKQVRRILTNVVYTGDVEISKTYRAYYRGITKPVTREKGERFYVEGHHEAIVDHGIFDRVQELLREAKAGYDAVQRDLGGERNRREDKLQGLLYCGHCGNKMNLYRKTVKLVDGYGHYSTYVCRRASTYGEADLRKNIKADVMEEVVMELLRAHIAVYVDAKERVRMLNRKPEAAGKRAGLKEELSGKEARREKIGDFIRALYADFSDGLFSEGEYLEMKAGYVSELEALDREIAGLEAEIVGLAPDYAGNGEMAATFGEYLGAEGLTGEMARAFIRKIVCYGDDRFEVEWNFGDELADLVRRGAGDA